MRQAGRAHPATTPKPIDEKPGRAVSSSHPGGFTKFPSWEVEGLELEAFGRLGWGEGREGGSSVESWRGSHRTRAQPPGWSLTTRRLQSTRLAWLCTIAQQQAASLPRRSPWVQWLNAPQPGASPPGTHTHVLWLPPVGIGPSMASKPASKTHLPLFPCPSDGSGGGMGARK